MKEIRLLVDDKNVDSVLAVLNSLNTELVNEVSIVDKTTEIKSVEMSHNEVREHIKHEESPEEKREKLFSFASATIVFLTIAAIYFEIYDQTYVPPFLRLILAVYWLYSFAGIMVSRQGSDYWVSKLYFNVTK